MKQFILFLSFLSLIACTQKLSEIDVLKNEINQLHDVETMPNMGKIVKLIDQLKTAENNFPDSDENEVIKEELRKGISLLKAVDEDMMQWMRGYSPSAEGIAEEDKVDYFKQEKIKIERVKINMKISMDNGKELLEKYMTEM